MIIYVADLYNAGFGATLTLGGPESFFGALRDLAIIDEDCQSAVPLSFVPAHGMPQSLEASIVELNGQGVDIGC